MGRGHEPLAVVASTAVTGQPAFIPAPLGAWLAVEQAVRALSGRIEYGRLYLVGRDTITGEDLLVFGGHDDDLAPSPGDTTVARLAAIDALPTHDDRAAALLGVLLPVVGGPIVPRSAIETVQVDRQRVDALLDELASVALTGAGASCGFVQEVADAIEGVCPSMATLRSRLLPVALERWVLFADAGNARFGVLLYVNDE